MKLALEQRQAPQTDGGGEPIDRYILRVIPVDQLGETLLVDEVSLAERATAAGPRIILRWRRIFAPEASGSIVLGTFGDLDATAHAALKRLLSRLVADRREEIDVVSLVARATAEAREAA